MGSMGDSDLLALTAERKAKNNTAGMAFTRHSKDHNMYQNYSHKRKNTTEGLDWKKVSKNYWEGKVGEKNGGNLQISWKMVAG